MLLSYKLKELREQWEFQQRKVAAAIDIDTAIYCKIENGKYSPRKEQVIQLAERLKANKHELVKLWMADNIQVIITNPPYADLIQHSSLKGRVTTHKTQLFVHCEI